MEDRNIFHDRYMISQVLVPCHVQVFVRCKLRHSLHSFLVRSSGSWCFLPCVTVICTRVYVDGSDTPDTAGSTSAAIETDCSIGSVVPVVILQSLCMSCAYRLVSMPGSSRVFDSFTVLFEIQVSFATGSPCVNVRRGICK